MSSIAHRRVFLITVMINKRHGEEAHDTAGADCTAAPRASPEAGRIYPQVEVQRACRARLKAAGKDVRLVDARGSSIARMSPR